MLCRPSCTWLYQMAHSYMQMTFDERSFHLRFELERKGGYGEHPHLGEAKETNRIHACDACAAGATKGSVRLRHKNELHALCVRWA